jgi:hypothetical protein
MDAGWYGITAFYDSFLRQLQQFRLWKIRSANRRFSMAARGVEEDAEKVAIGDLRALRAQAEALEEDAEK